MLIFNLEFYGLLFEGSLLRLIKKLLIIVGSYNNEKINL
jgi:hypothetical protein